MIPTDAHVDMLGRRKKEVEVSPGTRYRRRDAPYMVWEVVTAYASVDAKMYVVLSNVSDPTWRKTLSLIELEGSGQYIRLRNI
ncbi:MAG TPA: hypothetical protein VKB42_01015 [Dongiaceae bacterium]|nr:hypothetical protein [Dongiaceae bacterium]